MDRQARDIDWAVRDEDQTIPWERVPIAVLMDIRRELRKLNSLLHCDNFMNIPWTLKGIRLNTAKPKRRKKMTTKRKEIKGHGQGGR